MHCQIPLCDAPIGVGQHNLSGLNGRSFFHPILPLSIFFFQSHLPNRISHRTLRLDFCVKGTVVGLLVYAVGSLVAFFGGAVNQ